MLSFVHLHLHTPYSFLDGFCRIDKLVHRIKEMGHPAVAITDHGGLWGIVEFYKKCRSEGIHPVIGCEVYFALDRTVKEKRTDRAEEIGREYGLDAKAVEKALKIIRGAPEKVEEFLPEVAGSNWLEFLRRVDSLGLDNYHLVLLAKNEEGLKNLYYIVTDAYQNGFYYRPRTDLSVLREHGRGLIALSACLAGRVPYLLLAGLKEEAERLVLEYTDVFDEFYLEVQPNRLPAQATANAAMLELSAKTGIPLVMTCDSHYISPDDYEAFDTLLCIQTNKQVAEENRLKFDNDFWLKTEEEIRKHAAYLEQEKVDEAMKNTVLVAEKCQVSFEFGNLRFPVYQLPPGETAESRLRGICNRRLLGYMLDTDEKVESCSERLEYELDVISRAGFAPYFLVTQDFINWAKKNNIMVGPGRGSAAGSLVTYLLGITNLDPLRFGLLFERFLNPERMEMPDIDVDFDYEYRDRVIAYAADKFGHDRLAHICTFGTIKPRSAIKDIGRALGLSYEVRDKISKNVPEGATSIAEALEESPVLLEYQKQYPKLFELAAKIENIPRHVSTHASGIVISPGPIVDYVPLFVDRTGQLVTQFEMNTIAELGLVKFDFLGLKTLTVIRRTLELIEESTGNKIDINRIPLDDQWVYRLYQEGETDGVFQMEGDAFKKMLKSLCPTRFSDLVAAAALFRPGPLGSGMVEDFIDRRHGRAEIDYPHRDLEPVLQSTYGVIVYQEQCMNIARVMAGYTLGQADLLRKAIGKKKPEMIAEHREYFIHGSEKLGIPGAVKRGYSEELAAHVYDLMESFGSYGFNVSHSTCYAYISYQTAYLKTYYPVQFMTALLSMESESGDAEQVKHYIDVARRMDIEILPPDINRSDAGFTMEGGGIRLGLLSVDGVGTKALEKILATRPFKDFDDFVERSKSVKTVVLNLIRAGAFDCFEPDRSKLINYYFDKYRPKDKKRFEAPPFCLAIKRAYEIETLGFPLTLTRWEKAKNGEKITVTGEVTEVLPHTDKRGRDMAFVALKTREGVRDVVIFSGEYKKYQEQVKKGARLQVVGKKDGEKVLCDRIKTA
ncbi:MAG: DNA polymerase III subunit alpha [Bacillota bacterium]